MTDREAFEAWFAEKADTGYVQRVKSIALWAWQAAIAHERSKVPAWVPVKEKMPDMPPDSEGFPRSCVVLIYCLDGYIGSAHAAIYDDNVEWYSDDDYSHNYVTHWMPLPARPSTSIASAIDAALRMTQ